MSVEVASLGVHVHGGMGFIEETGAAQHYRNARILSIYEGTTAIRPTTSSAARPARRRRHRKALARQIEATETALLACDQRRQTRWRNG